MAVMNKPDETIFASGAKTGEVITFPNLARGWGITFEETNGIPPMEYFNSLFKRLDEKDLYFLQNGIPEWSNTLDYPLHALVQHEGKFYRSIKAGKNQNPSANNSIYWKQWGMDTAEIENKIAEALSVANSKQPPATTLAGYGIADFIHKNLTSENLNDIKKTGVYGQAANANATTARNYPEQKAGALLVRPSAYGFMQEYVTFDDYNRYIRNLQANGNWSVWKRIDFQLNNTLTSTSTAQALTAAQGKVLNEKITEANNNIANVRTKLVPVRNASIAITLDATKRSDWFREMQIPATNGFGYYTQSFHGKSDTRVFTHFPLDVTTHFTAEVFHQTGYSWIRVTYPALKRSFETAVNFNNENLTVAWHERLRAEMGGLGLTDYKWMPYHLGIGNRTVWARLRFPVKADNQYFQFEVNPDASLDAPENIRFNLLFREETSNGSTNKYLAFPQFGRGETVAYRGWVQDNFLGKNGGTATGDYTFHSGNIIQTGGQRTIESNYRIRVNRNDPNYEPYMQVVNANINLAQPPSANRGIGSYTFVVKDGETERNKGLLKTVIMPNKHVFAEFGTYNAANTYQVAWKTFSETNNLCVGKTTDDGTNRLQVGGTISATAPADNANNAQVPTTAWVRKLAKPIADGKVSKAGDTMTGKLILPQIEVTQNNSGGKNIKIGDDAWIGDDAIGHGIKIKSQWDETKGFVAFGDLGLRLGRGLNYNGLYPFLEWEGNYFSLNSKNDEFTGIDFVRKGNKGDFLMRMEASWDKRWKFWTENSHEVYLPAKSGTAILNTDFTGTQAETGWTRLPNGLILQWGRTTVRNVRFPLAFPNRCFCVTFNVNNNAHQTMNNPMIVGIPTREQFEWYAWGTAQAAYWYAIGN